VPSVLTLDTQVWQYVVAPASRPERRDLAHAAKSVGLRLGFTYELVREVVDNARRKHLMQPVAATICELAGETLVESNYLAEARELCDALLRDHPEWIAPLISDSVEKHQWQTHTSLTEIVRGRAIGRAVPEEEIRARSRDSRLHDSLRHGELTENIEDVLRWPPEQLLVDTREAIALRDATPAAIAPSKRTVRPPVHLSPTELEGRFKLDLLREVIEVIDGVLDERDLRHLYADRLLCDARSFTAWALNELRATDLPTRRVAVAVALAQTLDGYQPSNMGDREHASVLTRVGLFVTGDSGLARAMGHPRFKGWVPSNWRLLEQPNAPDAMARLIDIVTQ
jgi:hypothetical protein